MGFDAKSYYDILGLILLIREERAGWSGSPGQTSPGVLSCFSCHELRKKWFNSTCTQICRAFVFWLWCSMQASEQKAHRVYLMIRKSTLSPSAVPQWNRWLGKGINIWWTSDTHKQKIIPYTWRTVTNSRRTVVFQVGFVSALTGASQTRQTRKKKKRI